MASHAVCIQRVAPPCFEASQLNKSKTVSPFSVKIIRRKRRSSGVRCSLVDFIGGDLVKPDIGRWLEDVEKHKAIAIYTPHEGGYEGRYLNRLKEQGYYFLDISARGLGDTETTLLNPYPVCPQGGTIHQKLTTDSALPPSAKGLVVWIIEAKVLSKSELQFLALLPSLRPSVRVIAECGNWRKFMWKPLAEIAELAAQE
ncbi:hypothetical protein F2Q70_00007853 [Brassica cretica]|uniref:NAD(P)H-quinone oxidoreductase subunit N, chloroplastic n=1 Tax=Brassica cretica TaxID=69181 RepID=A0A8S9LZD2_BRACR|nr:hypothetical protein F2Q70_00007853 [Brassica cretica]